MTITPPELANMSKLHTLIDKIKENINKEPTMIVLDTRFDKILNTLIAIGLSMLVVAPLIHGATVIFSEHGKRQHNARS